MRTELSFLQLSSAFLLSQSFSIAPRNETEDFKKLKQSDAAIRNEDLSYLYEVETKLKQSDAIRNEQSRDSENVTFFTYTIHRYPTNPDTNLTVEVINEIIENAFSIWSSVTPLQFSWVPPDQPAAIHLSFERGLHQQLLLLLLLSSSLLLLLLLL